MFLPVIHHEQGSCFLSIVLQRLKWERVLYQIFEQKAMIIFLMVSVINASLVAYSSLKQELIQLKQPKSQAANLHHKNSGLTNVYHPLARIDSKDLCQPQSLHFRHIRINSCRPSSQYKRAWHENSPPGARTWKSPILLVWQSWYYSRDLNSQYSAFLTEW